MRKSTMAIGEVARRRYWYSTDAQLVVSAWRESGVTLAAFAAQVGIDPRRLARWAKRLSAERTLAPVPRRATPAMRFHPVHVVTGPQPADAPAVHGGGSAAAIEIELGVGQTIRVAPGFASADLARVVEVLRAATAGRA